MSDKMRWRYEDTNPVMAAVDSATVIFIGDLLWQDGDEAKPASMIPIPEREFGNTTFAELIKEQFAKYFLGVAMQRSRNGDTEPIRVATTGVFEFDCLSGTFCLGDLIGVGMGWDSVNEAWCVPLNQQVDKVTNSRYAIARCAKREPSAVISVLVAIRSTVMTGGVINRA